MFQMSSTIAVLNSTAKHTATMIFVHGLRESGRKWVKILEKLRPDHLKIVCPTGILGCGGLKDSLENKTRLIIRHNLNTKQWYC